MTPAEVWAFYQICYEHISLVVMCSEGSSSPVQERERNLEILKTHFFMHT